MSGATFGRYELKYFLPFDKINELIQWSTPYLVPDIHAQPGSNARPHYLVQSVYFDTTTLRLYKEKIDGIRNRSKFRVRSYDPVPGPDAPVFVEIKNRRDTQVIKERVALPLAQVAGVLFNGLRLDDLALNSYQRKPLERFLYCYQTAELAPVVTVIYDRVPFTCREDKQVRLTIDTNLYYCDQRGAAVLFAPRVKAPVPLPGAILELKFDRLMPLWMRELVRRFDIRQQSISKYCYCVDAAVFNTFEKIEHADH